MKYELAYHLKCGMELEDGRNIRLESIRQTQTYAGLTDGVPNSQLNDSKVDQTMQWLRGVYPSEAVHLIEPKRRDFIRKPGDMESHNGFMGRCPEWLPMVCCNALFRSSTPTKDPKMDGSSLVIAWYQDEFALPIADEIIAEIQQLPWNSIATDYEY